MNHEVLDSFECGQSAALRGCFRALGNATDDHESGLWYAGYDTVPRSLRGRWPVSGPVPVKLQSLANGLGVQNGKA